MTRRILVYQENGLVYYSQEFNGDRSEGAQRLIRTVVTLDWCDVVSMFDGVPSTLENFQKTVEKVETAFTYRHEPLIISYKMPCEEEIWLFANGKLSLYSRYGESV